MAKTPSLGIRVQPETKAALDQAAKDDLRSVSSMVEKILVDWLRANAYLKDVEVAEEPKSTTRKRSSVPRQTTAHLGHPAARRRQP